MASSFAGWSADCVPYECVPYMQVALITPRISRSNDRCFMNKAPCDRFVLVGLESDRSYGRSDCWQFAPFQVSAVGNAPSVNSFANRVPVGDFPPPRS